MVTYSSPKGRQKSNQFFENILVAKSKENSGAVVIDPNGVVQIRNDES
jgi:hypothetical protein